jgi:L-erythro-3,5-diaminohexanoate dehydrogenase
MNYGFHRVIKPKGVIPQAAEIVDGEPIIKNPYELLLEVYTLNLDASSMKQIRDNYPENIQGRIMEIVKSRGKMHNPDTNSGGVLIGRVKEIGENFPNKYDLKTGEEIIPVASLTAIPLYLEDINGIKGDQVDVKGYAIVLPCYPLTRIPEDMSPKLALAAVDISSLVPQVYRNVKDYSTVLILGCGNAGRTAMSAIRKVAPNCKIIGIDYSDTQLKIIEGMGYADHLLKVDATQQETVHREIEKLTHGKYCDLVINCVNVENTETSSILAAKPYPYGKILFFCMRTRFDKASLGTDATGKDVQMIIGNGVAENQVEETFNLIREDEKLRRVLEKLFG